MRTYKNQTAEDMAKEYRKTTPNNMYGDELGFIEGYNQKTAEIQSLIEGLEITKLSLDGHPYKSDEVVNGFNAEQDRKIQLLKILL